MQFVLAMNPVLIPFVILYKALTGWIDVFLPPNVSIPFVLLNKSYSGWISCIRQIANLSDTANQMTMEFEQFQQEAIQLKARLNESQVLNENLRKEKVMWLAERQQLIDARDDLNEILKCEREMASKANTTDEINKLVEKIEKEKSRMKTSYKYFSGVSKAHRQKEDEWNTEKTRMAIELITERTYHEMELKNEQDRYKSIIQQKDDEHKAHIERVRREFERKLKKK